MTFILSARVGGIAMVAVAASHGAQELAQLPQDSVPVPAAFSFVTSLNSSAVNRSTRQAVQESTRGVIVDT